jgi:hypothetical protein
MRYRFIDEIVSLTLDGAPRIEVSKRFDPDDDVFRGPAGSHRVPESMLLELMAMTGGQLIARHLGGSRLPMLLKISECRFEGDGQARETLRAVAELGGVTVPTDGPAVAEAETAVYAGPRPIARARLMFACVDATDVGLVGGVSP